jgi:hypothetical protein
MADAPFISQAYAVTTEITLLEQEVPPDRRRNLTVLTHATTAGTLRVYNIDPDDNVRLDPDLGTAGAIAISANTLDIQNIGHSYAKVRITFQPTTQPGTVETQMIHAG